MGKIQTLFSDKAKTIPVFPRTKVNAVSDENGVGLNVLLEDKAPTSHASSETTYGVSSASNYGHAKASSTTPKANGTATVGSETGTFARGDHVHPLQTSVSGNAGTATKLVTARSISIGTDMTGSANFDGSGNIIIDVARRMCFVGQSSFTTTNPWYNFAEVSIDGAAYNDSHITFKVSIGYGDASSCIGILTAHVRTDGSAYWESGELVWEYAASGIDPSKFVLAHNNSANPTKAELWVKCDVGYQHYHFEVLSEHTRVGRGNFWTLYTKSSEGSASVITSGYTQIVSQLATLKNSISGNAFTATYAISTNRSGGSLRNIEVYDNTHTNFVNTNMLIAVRK